MVSAQRLAGKFHSEKLKAVWAGMAAHSMLPLDRLSTAAFGLMMLLMGHDKGWPIVRGGAQSLTDAMAKYFVSMGGEIRRGTKVESLGQLPKARAILLDLGPREILKIASDNLSSFFRRQLQHWHYGMGVYKVDWALSEPIPYSAGACRESATVHLGNSLEQILSSEAGAWNGKMAEDPFIILTQPSLFDQRAPNNQHTAWAYCHTPNGYTGPLTHVIEEQIERYAPGFRDCILARYESTPVDLEKYNPNYVGGDINGGSLNLGQLFTRPVYGWGAYKTSNPHIYICSASTPPGGGVHGLCGFFAAKKALRDIFHML